MTDLKQLEHIAEEVLHIFDIDHPPIPIEIMLQRPKPNMWEEVNITELSVGFLRTGGPFAPRMSLARLLARHILHSPWGDEHGLDELLKDDKTEEGLRSFARMLIMPAPMVRGLSLVARNPASMSAHFEVPEEDARLRLREVGLTGLDPDQAR